MHGAGEFSDSPALLTCHLGDAAYRWRSVTTLTSDSRPLTSNFMLALASGGSSLSP